MAGALMLTISVYLLILCAAGAVAYWAEGDTKWQ